MRVNKKIKFFIFFFHGFYFHERWIISLHHPSQTLRGEVPPAKSKTKQVLFLFFVSLQNNTIMAQHNWDFDNALSVEEFFDSYGCSKKGYKLVDCTSDDGNEFVALRLNTGKTQKSGPYKGRPVYVFFCLSRPLEEAGEVLDKDFLRKHWQSDLRLLEPIDGLKFGIAFLEGGDEDFDDLQ